MDAMTFPELTYDWAPSTSQFFSYYPKYEYLDNLISVTSKKKMNLFIDVKGCAQSLFQEWAIKHILNHSKDTAVIDTSLFSGVLEFISFHKQYAKKRNIDLNMYFFMESGKSSYHLEIHKEYKANRGLSDMFGLDLKDRELFHKILDKNYHVIDRVTNKIPGVNFIRLTYMEADFIPWYLLKHGLPAENVNESINIIYSTDKDMLQCLDFPNTYQFYRHAKNVKMISEKDIYSHWLKTEMKINDAAKWFPLALSIVGDTGDGYKGVGGIGATRLIEVFEYVMTLCGKSMDTVYENIAAKRPIFNTTYPVNNNSLKKIVENQDIVVRNLKLASFKLLSDYVVGGFPMITVEKRKQITENLENTNKCSGSNILINALNNAGLMGIVKESTIVSLF